MNGDELVQLLRAVGYAAAVGAWVRGSWRTWPRWNRVVFSLWLAVTAAVAVYALSVRP